MVETAEHLIDTVIPPQPIRQWVISFPKRLRCFLDNSDILQSILKVVAHEIRRCVINNSPDIPKAQFGAISFIQRFGNTLNYHPHFHFLVADGIFIDDPVRGLQFYEGTITVNIIAQVQESIRKRVLKLLQRRKLLSKEDVKMMLGFEHSGFSLNAEIKVESWDLLGLERLIRYCARPPFASENLRMHGGYVLYRFPKVSHSGMRQGQYEPKEFIGKIAAFIPPSAKHRRHYHGAFAPNSPLRSLISESAKNRHAFPAVAKKTTKKVTKASKEWRELIRRIYEVDPLICNLCGGNIKILGFITHPGTIPRILSRLGWPIKCPTFDDPNLLDQSLDFNNDAPQYIWKGKKIEVSIDQEAQVDLVKLEYLEHCRLEALWEKQNQEECLQSNEDHHDPPEGSGDYSFEINIDPFHDEAC